MEEVRKTSEEWQKEMPNPRVLDPDGWDRQNFRYSWYEEKITRSEYTGRVMVSTCIFKKTDDCEPFVPGI